MLQPETKVEQQLEPDKTGFVPSSYHAKTGLISTCIKCTIKYAIWEQRWEIRYMHYSDYSVYIITGTSNFTDLVTSQFHKLIQ